LLKARAFEIASLEKALANSTEFAGTRRVFQTVPRYMRRRAASHNVKRLPRRLREKALAQLAKDADPRRPSKRTRRRKKHIKGISRREIFARRPSSKKWLETHIWHAKRMKMVEMWGVRIAEHPNDKSTKALYRASKHQCVMHDASYIRAIELSGLQSSLDAIFTSVVDPTLPAVGSARFVTGVRQGSTFIHCYMQYPAGAIAPASFLWKPSTAGDADIRTIWVWIHPAAIVDVAMASLLGLPVTVIFKVMRSISSPFRSIVIVNSLNGDLVRFELTGPRCHAVLHKILQPTQPGAQIGDALVWNDLKDLRTPASLPPGTAISLTVDDPRISFPLKMPPRITSVSPESDAAIRARLSKWPEGLGAGAIWDAEVRERGGKEKIKESELNRRREQALVPGTPLSALPTDARVPILLLQRDYRARDAGVRTSGETESAEFVGGWDLVVPKGWGMAFWRNLIFAGARVGGLRERHSLHFESGIPFFPNDFPETPAHNEWATARQQHLQAAYDRTPKAKRPSFAKLGTTHPFEVPLAVLAG
ncbi:NUC188 domain-containing protein, partial [Blyttiomyces helicus]